MRIKKFLIHFFNKIVNYFLPFFNSKKMGENFNLFKDNFTNNEINLSEENKKLKEEIKKKDEMIENMKKEKILLNKLITLRDKKIEELKKELNDKSIQNYYNLLKNQIESNENFLRNIQNLKNEQQDLILLHRENQMINNRIQNPNNINNNNQRRPISNRVNNGLTQMEINKIPEEIVQNNINYESKFCSICLNNFKKGDLIKRLNCLHIFHKYCITLWLKKKNVCPIDKHVVDVNLND